MKSALACALRGARWLALLLGAALALWLWHTQWASPWLVIRNAFGTVMFSSPLPAGQEFGIRFTHSVALSPVEEWFAAEGGVLALKRTLYQDFGAGLPHDTAQGQRMTFVDGHILLSGFTLTLPKLDVRVGRVAGHELLLPPMSAEATGVGGVGDKGRMSDPQAPMLVLPLTAWAAPGAALSFTVEVPPLWQRIVAFLKSFV